MKDLVNRRDLLKLAGMGVAVFVSGTTLSPGGGGRRKENESFFFVQLSDTHWGFNGPSINPDSQDTLKKAVAAVTPSTSSRTSSSSLAILISLQTGIGRQLTELLSLTR